jgi:hypothetical protein
MLIFYKKIRKRIMKWALNIPTTGVYADAARRFGWLRKRKQQAGMAPFSGMCCQEVGLDPWIA